MVQDSAQIRRRGALDFAAYYEYSCARLDALPLPAVKMNLAKGILDFNGDRVKLSDWPPILSSIAINQHLDHISVSSSYQACLGAGDAESRYSRATYKRKMPAIRSKEMTLKLCKALRDCLTVSFTLKTLRLIGLPLRERDLIILTKGLAKSVSLENLSLANCAIADEGLEVICQSVKYSSSIKTVDFTGCNLTWRGAEHMANIIKHQGMRRYGTAWAQSLRYRQPEFEGMGGLRRVTLNCNTLIGDRGSAALAQELTEDLWLKAVDLQKCGLSNEGARRLLEALKTNSTLYVLDIRSNPLVDKALIKTLIEKVLMNAEGKSSEFYWIKPPSPRETQKTAGPKWRTLQSTARRKATINIASHRGVTVARASPGVSKQQRNRSLPSGVPWRTAARAGRQRGLPPGVSVGGPSFQGGATVKVTVESGSEGSESQEEEVVEVQVKNTPASVCIQGTASGQQYKRMQEMELEQCRQSLTEERRARLKAESKLKEYELDNFRLRSLNSSLSEALATRGLPGPAALSVLEDEAVLESIETSFSKFHAFLDLLKDAGLGQLASIAGIDQSDFCSPGRPQLSPTDGKRLAASGSSLSGGTRSHIGVKTHAGSLGAQPLTAAAGDQAATFNLRPPTSPGGFLLVDRSLSQASSPAIDPCVDLVNGGEPYHFAKPEVWQDSGSECSFRCRKSDGNGSLSDKTSHISGLRENMSHSSHHKSNGNSHSHTQRSKGSHRYSYNYSSVHSDSLLSNRSGDLSQRSSLSGGTSLKMESDVSPSSKGRGGGDFSDLPGRGFEALQTLEQMRSLGSPCGQSDDGSF